MLSLKGKYENGIIKLVKKIKTNKPVEVIVTFLDENLDETENITDINKFSFLKSQKILEKYDCNFSDEVINERRSYL